MVVHSISGNRLKSSRLSAGMGNGTIMEVITCGMATDHSLPYTWSSLFRFYHIIWSVQTPPSIPYLCDFYVIESKYVKSHAFRIYIEPIQSLFYHLERIVLIINDNIYCWLYTAFHSLFVMIIHHNLHPSAQCLDGRR